MKIQLSKKEKNIIGIVGLLIFITPFIFTLKGCVQFDADTGAIGDTIGGITAPFLGFFGSILVYLALKAQIKANGIIKKQFKKQKDADRDDFIFDNYKQRINLVINEINSFNISFHGNTLISNIENVGSFGKKYNFTGIQAINLYLIEYFRIKVEFHKSGKGSIEENTSFHAIFLNLNNLIGLFYRTHLEIISTSLTPDYKLELEEMLKYVYYSKLNYFIELYIKNDPNNKLGIGLKELYEYYKLRK